MKIKAKQLQVTEGKLIQGTSTGTSETVYTFPQSDGTTGQVLATDGSGVLSFSTVSGGSGGGGFSYSAESSSFAPAVNYHYSCNITASTTLTLPTSGSGQISFKNMNATALTVQSDSTKTLDGTTQGSVELSQYDAVTLITDTSGNWEIR